MDLRNEPTTALHTNSLTTILVVDIRDFTPLARTLPEALLSQTIGTWFLRSGQIVQRLGSWAQKYIGDAVMAVWVHDRPEQVGADILRVLRAVSEINTATAEISKTLALPVPLRIGAGVNTGPAILGGTDYTALGDTVNAAFRLESATKGIGLGVAVGESVYHELAVAARSRFRPPGSGTQGIRRLEHRLGDLLRGPAGDAALAERCRERSDALPTCTPGSESPGSTPVRSS